MISSITRVVKGRRNRTDNRDGDSYTRWEQSGISHPEVLITSLLLK